MKPKISKIEIIPIQETHLDAVTSLYLKDLDTAILSYFGYDYVFKMLKYNSKNNLGFVAIDKNTKHVIGFIFSSKSNLPLSNFLNLKTIFTIFFNIIYFPTLIYAIVKSFLNYIKKKNYFKVRGVYIEITHFCVSKHYQGKKIGRSLLKALENRAKIKAYNFVLTSTHNKRLAKYYIKSKNAEIILTSNIGIYKSYLIKWHL